MKLLNLTKRPWGWMVTIVSWPSLWLKVLRVRGSTSYQSHKNRTEWVVGVFKIEPGEKHRYNRGVFLELATGQPEEDDIIRYEDEYDRCN